MQYYSLYLFGKTQIYIECGNRGEVGVGSAVNSDGEKYISLVFAADLSLQGHTAQEAVKCSAKKPAPSINKETTPIPVSYFYSGTVLASFDLKPAEIIREIVFNGKEKRLKTEIQVDDNKNDIEYIDISENKELFSDKVEQ